MKKLALEIKNTIKKMKKCTFIKIDISFILIFIIAFLLDEIWFYFCYTASMILHEFAHFFVAKKLGYYPSKIRLSFFGAKLEGDDDFLLADEIKIVLAGPLFNLCVIVLCYLSFWFNPESYNFLYDILIANWSLFVFNSLPIFPLDFGRFLLAVNSVKNNRIEALKSIKRFSIIFIIFIFVLYAVTFFYFKNFSFGFVCVNLMSLCLSSARDTSYKRQLFVSRKFERLSKGLPEKNIYVSDTEPLYSLYKFIDDSHFINFIFLSPELDIKNKITEVELYKKFGMLD